MKVLLSAQLDCWMKRKPSDYQIASMTNWRSSEWRRKEDPKPLNYSFLVCYPFAWAGSLTEDLLIIGQSESGKRRTRVSKNSVKLSCREIYHSEKSVYCQATYSVKNDILSDFQLIYDPKARTLQFYCLLLIYTDLAAVIRVSKLRGPPGAPSSN